MGTRRAGARHGRILNVVRSRRTGTDWGIERAIEDGVVRRVRPLPAEVDLRARWWTVGDQGKTGACVGWATADGALRWHLVRAGRLRPHERLSPRFVWMASKETDTYVARPETFLEKAGTSLKAALDICRKFGAVRESLLPFAVHDLMYTGDADAFFAAAARRRVGAYYNLRRSPDAWRTWLATRGPVVAAVNVDASWHDAGRRRGELGRYRRSTAEGGHAVVIVGYRRDGRFVLRNSWGPDWGDGGHAYATADWARAAFLRDTYGIAVAGDRKERA